MRAPSGNLMEGESSDSGECMVGVTVLAVGVIGLCRLHGIPNMLIYTRDQQEDDAGRGLIFKGEYV